jgi:hypothetical protein
LHLQNVAAVAFAESNKSLIEQQGSSRSSTWSRKLIRKNYSVFDSYDIASAVKVSFAAGILAKTSTCALRLFLFQLRNS